MALKKSDLYSSLWRSCSELRGSMDASQYKDYNRNVLDDPDSELTALQGRLPKARSIKQRMMQQLITGHTRLPVPGQSG